MASFQPVRSIPTYNSLEGWGALEDHAVSYGHAFLAVSSALTPVVRSMQTEIETLERERDALLSRVRTELPEYFVMPPPPMIEVRARIDEIEDAPFFVVDHDY